MLTEKIMEDAICENPEKYLGEQGLKFISRQFRIGNYIFDLIFEDRHGAKLIVELQKGTLDRTHTYKILDYYHEYKEKNPQEFIELMVIANSIPKERKKRLNDWGVSCKEIPEPEFREQLNHITQKITEINNVQTSPIVKLTTKTIYNNKLFTEKFKDALNKCDKSIQNLFYYILKEMEQLNIDKKALNCNRFNLIKKYIFCGLILHRNKIDFHLRVDSNHLSSNVITLSERKEGPSSKQWWMYFEADKNTPQNEIIRLIKEVYKFSE